MLSSFHHLAALSNRYGICQEDILLSAMNVCGLRANLDSSRTRFRVRLTSRPGEAFYIILPIRDDAPFELRDGSIWFSGERVADTEELELDDAVLSYFRNGTRVLTLNSNARSQCVGCAFCYTILQEESDPRLRLLDDINAYLTLVEERMGWRDLTELDTLGVCTGCFRHEDRAIDHLLMVRDCLAAHSASPTIQFLSSVIRTQDGIERLRREVRSFHLTLTIECLTNRSAVLKESKASLTYEEMLNVLRRTREVGFHGDFTYIVGLDSLDVMRQKLPALINEATTFPRFQLFQAHSAFMQAFACPEATTLDYYLTARQMIEHMFADSTLRPRSWENYRPLWYFSFGGESLTGTRI